MILLLNGPPYSGKDAVANIVVENYRNWTHLKMSMPIKAAIREMFSLGVLDQRTMDAFKDEPLSMFNDKSYRQIQISLSEEWIKPTLGHNALGNLIVSRIRGLSNNIVISDIGFEEEVKPIIKAFPKNVCIIRLERDGTNFDNDSRDYIHPQVVGEGYFKILQNNFDKEMLEVQVERTLREWNIYPKGNSNKN